MSEQRGGGDELPPLDRLDEIVSRIALRFGVGLAIDPDFEALEDHRDEVVLLAADAERALEVFVTWIGIPHSAFGYLDPYGPLLLFLSFDIEHGISGRYQATRGGSLVSVDIGEGALAHELAHFVDCVAGEGGPWSDGPVWRRTLERMPKTLVAADLRDAFEDRRYHATPRELFAEALATGCRLATGERALLADAGVMPTHPEELEDALIAIEVRLLVPLRQRAWAILAERGEEAEEVVAWPIHLTVPPVFSDP